MTVAAHTIMAVAAGLTVGVLVAIATAMAPQREVMGSVIAAWWRVGLPLLLGGETWNAADRNGWVVAVVFVMAACALVAVSAWERRNRA